MNSSPPNEPALSGSTEGSDAIEAVTLLNDQAELLWRVFHDATEPPGKLNERADLANFLLSHGLHIHEMARTALVLMETRRPYAVTLLARSALESTFCMMATVQNREFGPQRLAYEFEELARKLKCLIDNKAWDISRHPTPDDCLRESARIRRLYAARAPVRGRDRDRIQKIERIAEAGGLSPFYNDDYRQLSLAVHCNQAGIFNSASGFLVRKGMLALCNATFLACQALAGPFRIKAHDDELRDHHIRMKALMLKPDFFGPPPPHGTPEPKRETEGNGT